MPRERQRDWYDGCMSPDTDQLIQSLGLSPHPEGGHYRRVYASATEIEHAGQRRPALTAIQFLLRQGERSRWHRVDADEAWHWQQGGHLVLQIFDPQQGRLDEITLGAAAQAPGIAMAVVPAGHWQRAWTEDVFAVVACTVSPGFVWEGFALLDAAPDVAHELERLGAADA